MRHVSSLAIALFVICTATSAADVPDQKSDLAANAALQYWQAFSQLPALDKEQEKYSSEWNSAPLNHPAVVKLLGESRNSLMYLGRGSQLNRCDWGLEYSDGVALLLPHLAKSRDLARLAALDGRRAFERRDFKAGWNNGMAMIALGRHVNRDLTMISLLVGTGIEGMAIDLLAPYVPDIGITHAQALAEFSALPPARPFTESLTMEKKYMAGWIIKKLRDEDARQPGAWRELWKSLFAGTTEENNFPEVESVAAAVKLVEDILPLYDELARFMAMPQEQFDAQYPAFKQKTKADHKLATLLLPAIDKVREKEIRTQVRRAMLLTAIAVAETGPEKVNQSKDPISGKPFEYHKLEKGFELKSQVAFEGQPITLIVGQPK
jgi:hypothetical protein